MEFGESQSVGIVELVPFVPFGSHWAVALRCPAPVAIGRGVGESVCDAIAVSSVISFFSSDTCGTASVKRAVGISKVSEMGVLSDPRVGADSPASSETEISSRNLETCRWNFARLRGVEQVGVEELPASSTSELRLRFLATLLSSIGGASETGLDSLLFGSVSICEDQPFRTARSQV